MLVEKHLYYYSIKSTYLWHLEKSLMNNRKINLFCDNYEVVGFASLFYFVNFESVIILF